MAQADGDLVHLREPWRLIAALLLLGWSFLGRPIVLLLAARPGGAEPPLKPAAVEHLASDTGSRLAVEQTGPAGASTVVLTHGWGLDRTIWPTGSASPAG